MGDIVIKTDVDRLISLVEQKKEISMEDAAKELGISPKVIESLGDILEEEGIVHIKYKFTTPYFVHETQKLKSDLSEQDEEALSVEEELDMKREFFSKTKARGVSDEQARQLWKAYAQKYKDFMKKQFFEKAQQKGYPKRDIELMWKKVEGAI